MRKSKLLLLLGVFMLVACASPAMSATTLKKMGSHPFYTPPLTSVADLQTMVQKRGAKIEEGFTKAGAADLYPAFVEQFPNAQIESVQVQPGQSIDWMLFRKWGKGQVAAAKNIVWGGGAPFEAFKFTIEKDGNQYNFIVPLVCGNIALLDVTAAPVAVVEPVQPVEEPAPAPAPVAPAPAKALGAPFAIIGYSHQWDPSEYIFGKVGYDFAITDQFHVLPSLGLYGQVQGDDGETSFPVIDVLASYYVMPELALGIGVGYWHGELQTRDAWGRDHDYGDDKNFDLILAAYYDLPTDWFGMKPSVYVEGRCDMENMDEPDLTGRLGAGLMIHF
ncbi:MAG: hypothetical protein LBU39_07895 [Desulfobulbaceae bacterium]|nr:hypothetical protein [Desulfobulbaceae bacterium]